MRRLADDHGMGELDAQRQGMRSGAPIEHEVRSEPRQVPLASEHRVAKPNPAIYQITADQLGREPAELVCVGDDPDKDVAGPQRAGWRAVWNRRDGQELPADITPDATVELLTELPDLIRQW